MSTRHSSKKDNAEETKTPEKRQPTIEEGPEPKKRSNRSGKEDPVKQSEEKPKPSKKKGKTAKKD
jgi:hypothetical protein